jgi:hypothetical protein
MIRRVALLVAAFAPAALGQFQLLVLNGPLELAVPAVYDFGRVDAGDSAVTQFRLRNTSTSPATVFGVTVAGAGFTIPHPPVVPATLGPQQALDFTVAFQADGAGSYSAGLTVSGVSVILSATIVPGLTYRIPAKIDFGTVERGGTAVLPFAIENRSTQPLAVPPILLRGAGFAISGTSPAELSVNPQQSVTLALAFSPNVAGAFSGTVSIGDRTFAMTGIGSDPPSPKPVLQVELPQPAGGQQGTVRVNLDAAARTAASGTLALDFVPAPKSAADPAIAFASGGRSVAFTVQEGDTQAVAIGFQTGTTAGTLTFTATIGGTTVQSAVSIAPTAVVISAATAARGAGGVTLQLTGFDNTRTAGQLAFTFYDRGGNVIAPGRMPATADFATYFQSSGIGGVFLLNAVFPVNGDSSQIGAFDVELTNSAGLTKVPRTAF